jgi:hypothetical protein
MSRVWALLVDNIIGNVIVAEEDFIESHPDFSALDRMDITDYDPQPGVMWKLEGNKFLAPDSVKPEIVEHRLEESNYEIEVKP